ncbi:MAG TPA: VOC family protein [Acidimicrobiia bacterium]|nr:VOC family protein [Acidimicrobiia bacterium]
MVRLAHVILRVADLGGAVEFYRDTLGLPVSGVGPAFAFFDAGGVRIALNRVDGGDAAARMSATELVLDADDVEERFAAWKDAGVPFEAELRPVMEQDGRRLLAAHFRDPEGHLVSLTGWESSVT